MNTYRCPHCGKYQERESTKKHLRSWCETAGRFVRLQLVKPTNTPLFEQAKTATL